MDWFLSSSLTGRPSTPAISGLFRIMPKKYFYLLIWRKKLKGKRNSSRLHFGCHRPHPLVAPAICKKAILLPRRKEICGQTPPDPHPPHPDQSRLSKGHSISGQPWCSMNSPALIFCQHVFCKSCCHNNRISMNDFKQEKVDSAGNIYYQVPFFVFQNLT